MFPEVVYMSSVTQCHYSSLKQNITLALLEMFFFFFALTESLVFLPIVCLLEDVQPKSK